MPVKIFSIVFLLCTLSANAQHDSLRIAFYNLENLFHPENDSLTNDDEFTPEGSRHWTPYRYNEKCNRMAKAILSIGEWTPPAVVGVAEIENYQVLKDLIVTPALKKFGYGIIHYESPDRRGIDVGMIYRKEIFNPIFSRPIAVTLDDDPDFHTRDILYCKGIIGNSDTLHLFFCHWPSRYGGQAASEPKRIQAASILKSFTDSIFTNNPQSKIIIAGDLNDEWNNKSVLETLSAKAEGPATLINLMAKAEVNQGSHRYRGKWSYLDQIIVSSNLLFDEGYPTIKGKKAQSCQHNFLLEQDEKYPGKKPFRTFIGFTYHGGFSDHLPVFLDLIY